MKTKTTNNRKEEYTPGFLEKQKRLEAKKLNSGPGKRDEDFEDDGAYPDDGSDEFDDWGDDDEGISTFDCNACGWTGGKKPIWNQCPKCDSIVEEGWI